MADEAGQARYVVEKILDHRECGLALKDQAVLFRASHHSGVLEVELTRHNIPFVKFGGLKFLEAAHIKDILAFLRWAENPRDRVAGFRLLQLLPGIGPTTAMRALDSAVGPADPSQSLPHVRATGRGEAGLAGVRRYSPLGARRGGGMAGRTRPICRWYEPHLERIHEDAAMRQADLVQLAQIAQGYPSRERFLTELTLDPPDATSDEAGGPLLDEDYLILSTIHSAKGQEWKSVFILNSIDGCIPSDLATGAAAEIEEERRLLYVAMTRAKDHLHLIIPQRFYVHSQRSNGDRHMYASRTRFIPANILNCFEKRTWPPAPKTATATPSPKEPVDIGARMHVCGAKIVAPKLWPTQQTGKSAVTKNR